jgi:hypothetical protein
MLRRNLCARKSKRAMSQIDSPPASLVRLEENRNCQPACKPGSVWPPRFPARTWRPFLWDIRCRMPRCDLPGQLARKQAGGLPRRVVPIRSCSRWGLPCRCRCRRARWALTPPFHPCRGKPRRFLFCGTFPQVRRLPAFLAGRYPASCFHGARTFLRRSLSASASAATRPAGAST